MQAAMQRLLLFRKRAGRVVAWCGQRAAISRPPPPCRAHGQNAGAPPLLADHRGTESALWVGLVLEPAKVTLQRHKSPSRAQASAENRAAAATLELVPLGQIRATKRPIWRVTRHGPG